MKTWHLKKGADQRFRRGHPWIFASELAHSAKEVAPGEVVELVDALGKFLAYGYTNPSSQICFRRLSSRKKESDVASARYFGDRLRTARALRKTAGLTNCSHRWVFAEADGVPGLIVDAFLGADGGWRIVVQASTAGMERSLPEIFSALREFKNEFGGEMTIIEAPSSKARVLEGLQVGEKRVIEGRAEGLEHCRIRLRHGLELTCDLLHGQKTGFFLDQQSNASYLRGFTTNQFAGSERAIKVLDICSYVGQWSSHLAHALKIAGVKCEVTLLDVSRAALDLAVENVGQYTENVQAVEGDALEAVSGLGEGVFDIVVCDPPAFVKKKADLPQGVKAYVKLNRMAMRTVSAGGLFVASSCSGLVKAPDWEEILVQSSMQAGRTYKQLIKVGHAADHPVRAEFPEGEYLKCVLGVVDYPF